MSAEPTPDPYMPPNETDPGADPHYTPRWRRLALLSYGIACASPMAFLVMALLYPQRDARVQPSVSIQAIWWALGLCAPIGAVFGLIVLVRSRGQTLGYRRMGVSYAGAGVLVGTVAALFLPVGTGVLNALRRSNHLGLDRFLGCEYHLRDLSRGVVLYVQDYDDHFPLSATWNKTVVPYASTPVGAFDKELLHCPEALPDETRPTYAMLHHLQDFTSAEVGGAEKTPMFFDSVPGDNLVGGQELLPNPPRHGGYAPYNIVVCLDEHLKDVHPAEVADLCWDPQRITQPDKHSSPKTKGNGTPKQ